MYIYFWLIIQSLVIGWNIIFILKIFAGAIITGLKIFMIEITWGTKFLSCLKSLNHAIL